jgi:hypothetical protein
MADIVVNDVVLRDGLQDEPRYVEVARRVELAEQLLAAGLRHLEVASFVNPQRVPQMGGAEELLAALPRRHDVTWSAIRAGRDGFAASVEDDRDHLEQLIKPSGAAEGVLNGAGRHREEPDKVLRPRAQPPTAPIDLPDQLTHGPAGEKRGASSRHDLAAVPEHSPATPHREAVAQPGEGRGDRAKDSSTE